MRRATADRIRTARLTQALRWHNNATPKGRYSEDPALLASQADGAVTDPSRIAQCVHQAGERRMDNEKNLF